LNREIAPQAIWDALFVGAGELLVRQPGIVALHAVTSTNALRYAWDTSSSDDTRRMLLLQNAAFVSMFRQAMTGRGPVKPYNLDEMQPVSLESEGPKAVQEIFADVSGDKMKAAGKVLTLDRSLENTLPYLFALLGIEDPSANLQQIDAQLRRQRTFDALKRLFLRESLNQPVLLLLEDLHWLDSETQAWLHLFSDRVASARLLLLVNYRPEYQHGWGSKTYYTQLRLDPLGPEEAHALLASLLGSDAALQPLTQFILAKTEGNPFFMEEMVQTLVDQGVLRRDPAGGMQLVAPVTSGALAALQLPPTVH